MKPNEEIMNFLKENPTFYLATVDGYLPRVRPLGFAMWYKGHLCLAIGKHKAAYKQLLDNTNLELCAANDRGEQPSRSCPSWKTCTTRRPATNWASSTWIIFPPSCSRCRGRSRTS